MSGNKAGGIKAGKTNKARYGEDFFRKIGSIGGKISKGGGFAANRDLAREAGRKGGMASRLPRNGDGSIKRVNKPATSRAVYTATPSPRVIKAFFQNYYECPTCEGIRFKSLSMYQAHYWDEHGDGSILQADK